jgi:hypothetical protein
MFHQNACVGTFVFPQINDTELEIEMPVIFQENGDPSNFRNASHALNDKLLSC